MDVSRSGLRVECAAPIGKGQHLQIILPDRTVIFGNVRHCTRVSAGYHVGVAIEVVYYAHPLSEDHIPEKQLKLYADGGGLTALEAIHVKNHLLMCRNCGERLAKFAPDSERAPRHPSNPRE